MENERAKNLAEKIALLLQENAQGSDDFAALRSSIEKINERLNKIEVKLESPNFIHPSSFILHPSKTHPSQEKFAVAEAVAQEIIEHFGKEKPCLFEPHGKPCDHCSMCSSRGF